MCVRGNGGKFLKAGHHFLGPIRVSVREEALYRVGAFSFCEVMEMIYFMLSV